MLVDLPGYTADCFSVQLLCIKHSPRRYKAATAMDYRTKGIPSILKKIEIY